MDVELDGCLPDESGEGEDACAGTDAGLDATTLPAAAAAVRPALLAVPRAASAGAALGGCCFRCLAEEPFARDAAAPDGPGPVAVAGSVAFTPGAAAPLAAFGSAGSSAATRRRLRGGKRGPVAAAGGAAEVAPPPAQGSKPVPAAAAASGGAASGAPLRPAAFAGPAAVAAAAATGAACLLWKLRPSCGREGRARVVHSVGWAWFRVATFILTCIRFAHHPSHQREACFFPLLSNLTRRRIPGVLNLPPHSTTSLPQFRSALHPRLS